METVSEPPKPDDYTSGDSLHDLVFTQKSVRLP
jgi:hypothetical protein